MRLRRKKNEPIDPRGPDLDVEIAKQGRIRAVWSAITPAGRAALVLGIGSIVLATFGGYTEFTLVAWVILGLFAISATVAALPAPVDARIDLSPAHTVAKTPSRGVLIVKNKRRIRLYRPLVLLDARYRGSRAIEQIPVRLGVIGGGTTERSTFTLEAPRRGILKIGPAKVFRTDPSGFFARQVPWAPEVELVVRPRIVPIGSLGSGLMHDLEGVPSDSISMSDLSFHALREYVRGDDLRHVHWRSAARTGTLYVRQYHDTRRNHVLVLLDNDLANYSDGEAGLDEFELAASLAASVVARCALDGAEVTFVCGAQSISGTNDEVLDSLARVYLRRDQSLLAAARSARGVAASVGRVVVATGAHANPADLEQVAQVCGSEEPVLVLQGTPGQNTPDQNTPGQGAPRQGESTGPAAMTRTARTRVLAIDELDAFPSAISAYLMGQGR